MKSKCILIFITALMCCSAASITFAGGRPPHGPPPWIDPPDKDEILLRIEALEEMYIYLEEDLTGILLQTLPAGAVLAFAGTKDMLPDGWAFCDGANGTPNLTDRFLVGTADDLNVGKTGGANEHDHGVLEHYHRANTPEHEHEIPAFEVETKPAGEHHHSVSEAIGEGRAGVDQDPLGVEMYVAAYNHSHYLHDQNTEHYHVLNVPARETSPAEGTTSTTKATPETMAANHMPPYYKLAFIVKTGVETPKPGFASSSDLSLTERLDVLEDWAMDLRLQMDETMSDRVPLGLIVAWTGSPESVPEGWLLCDGQNGTPNLTNHYIMGASIDDEIGMLSGTATHVHAAGNHTHTTTLANHFHWKPFWDGATQSVPDHIHELEPGTGMTSAHGGDDAYASVDGHTHTVSPTGGHAHDLFISQYMTSMVPGDGVTEEPSYASTESASHYPPYYQLAFIQKAMDMDLTGIEASAPVADAVSDLAELIENLEVLFAAMSSELSSAIPYLAQDDSIALWSGLLGEIPEGWAFCDGEGGTPDLRGRFVLGADELSGVIGGSDSHRHELESHAHLLSFSHNHPGTHIAVYSTEFENLPHSHTLAMNVGINCDAFPNTVTASSEFHSHGYPLLPGPLHKHQVELDNGVSQYDGAESETGLSGGFTAYTNNLPKHIRLAYVMKLSDQVE